MSDSITVTPEIDPNNNIGSVVSFGISSTNSSVAPPVQNFAPLPEVYQLFPTTAVKFRLGREFTKKELDVFGSVENIQKPNQGNTTSVDNYILKNNRKLKDLEQFFVNSLNFYIKEMVAPKNPVTPYITQSWINFTKTGQFHHVHQHPNSYLSGVFYINADPAVDRITFSRTEYRQIQVPTDNYNIHNSHTWWLPAGTGELIIFPSHLTHQVNPVTTEKTRISLSFNTFLTGVLGANDELTELIL
jgi:uncharacterized protein (TIGR02466 family)